MRRELLFQFVQDRLVVHFRLRLLQVMFFSILGLKRRHPLGSECVEIYSLFRFFAVVEILNVFYRLIKAFIYFFGRGFVTFLF